MLCLALAALLLLLAAAGAAESVGTRTPLNYGWTACSPSFGCFPELALPHEILRLFTSNPHWEFEEHRLRNISLVEWTYSRSINLSSSCQQGVNSRLYFHRIDTIATVSLNGEVLAETRNSMIPHTVALPQCAIGLLEVRLQSSLLYARNKSRHHHDYPHSVNYNVWAEPSHRNLLRKPASHFGWDWGPAFPSQSLGEVVLEQGPPGWAFLQLDQFRVDQTHHANGSAVHVCLTAYIRKWAEENFNQTVTIRFARFEPVRLPVLKLIQAKACFLVRKPRLWHPLGGSLSSSRGERRKPNYLYRASVQIDLGGGELHRTIGLRHVRLRTESVAAPPTAATTFQIEVNGRSVDWRGANLVPFDVWQYAPNSFNATRVVRNLLRMNMNAVRVWGGGGQDFLPPDFYHECDLWGILVWQDLPWACATFPVFADVYHETVYLTRTTQHHASVVVWGGNNEVEAAFEWFANDMAPHKQRFVEEYDAMFVDTIWQAARDWGGVEIYLDSSPSNGMFPVTRTKQWGDVTDPTRGDIHFYNYTMDCTVHGNFPGNALFVSEFGFQSLPWTLPRYVSNKVEEGRLEAVLKDRLRHEHGFEELDRQVRNAFRFDGSGRVAAAATAAYPARALLSQIAQGKCLAAAITGAWRPFAGNSGTLIWQLNDVWPGVSWSLMEFDGTWKASAFAVRSAFQPIRIKLSRVVKGQVVVATLQWYAEYADVDLAGYFTLDRFGWGADDVRRQSVMVHFKLDAASADRGAREHVVWTTTTSASLGGYVVRGGVVVVGAAAQVKSAVFLPLAGGEWLPPMYDGAAIDVKVEFNTEGDVRWRQVACDEIVVSARPSNRSNKIHAHVWLYWEDDDGQQSFDTNGFLLLPGRDQRVRLISNDDDDGECRRLDPTLLRVATVVLQI